MVKRITSKKKLKAKLQASKKWLGENMHLSVKKLIEKLNIKLEGHYRYYGVTGNSNSMEKFRYLIIKQGKCKELKKLGNPQYDKGKADLWTQCPQVKKSRSKV